MYASRMSGDDEMSNTVLTAEMSMTALPAAEGENRERAN